MARKRILVAPLDWGLGHVTRCIPLIQELLQQSCEVWLAAEGMHAQLLHQEFPELPLLPLRGYRIRYTGGHGGGLFVWNIARQIPQMMRTIEDEQKWLQQTFRTYRWDAVISDNRFGLFHPDIPTVIITHQLQILLPHWLQLFPGATTALRTLNYRYIERYTHCWVPDWAGPENLSGKLSHPHHLPRNIRYIGPLSRLRRLSDVEKNYDLIALISGPEPQRSLLEKRLIEQLQHAPVRSLLIRGKPNESNQAMPISPSLTTIAHLPAEQLNAALQAAHAVISRSGYTTIMDLVALNQKAILIPTPGQTEQEYLAVYHYQKGSFLTAKQANLQVVPLLAQLNQMAFPAQHFPENMQLYKQAVLDLINSL
ncbi:MAG: glycosyl transferase family 28 [Thermoflavifilum sp.]|nr:glycosyl transferase family 28 [Thermoflavifilum sp.]